MNKKLGILGPSGTFTEMAAMKYMPDCEPFFYITITEIFEAIEKEEIKEGIVPIENILNGHVMETLDCLYKSRIKIKQAIIIPIEQSLVILPETQKIEKIIATNTIDADKTSSWLLKIAGIGHVKAKELEKNGVKTEKDLFSPKIFDALPEETRVFLTKKPLEKISRNSIAEFEAKFAQNFPEEFMIVGSYRRGASTSGDIDLMVVGDVAIFQRAQDVLRDVFGLVSFAMGEYRVSGIITLPDKTNAHIDLFCVPYEERASQMLYGTGSMMHNVKMRGLAKRRGMLLNQRGLFDRKTGVKIPTLTERDIYNNIEMTYVPPTERN